MAARLPMLAALAGLALASPALAQETPARPDSEGGRYLLRQVDNGFLRVDRESGDTSLCRERGGAWLCEAVADDREALEDEIARLAEENAALARRIGELETQLATGEPGAEPDGDESEREVLTLELPTEEELDRMMQTFEGTMRRFLDMMRSLKDDPGSGEAQP